MKPMLYRKTLFAMYQASLVFGILMLPIAILVRRVGLTLPVHRLVDGLANAYEDAADSNR